MEIFQWLFTEHLLFLIALGVVTAQIKIPLDYLNAIRIDRAEEEANGPYNYDNQGDDWSGLCSTGERQSPIDLISAESNFTRKYPRIRFHNYRDHLQTPLVLTNNGHTANLVIPVTVNGKRPYINGGLLKADYEAQSVHFHWGSENSKGSEHAINYVRYDVEVHIVHKNKRYANISEASLHEDGLAVVGVMLEGFRQGRPQAVLDNVFDQLPRIIKYNSSATISGTVTMDGLMGRIIPGVFYAYEGSLTTPDCAEAVSWIVFTDVGQVSKRKIMKFWKLLDSRNRPLINNYRNIQDTYRRPVYFRPYYYYT